MAQPLELSPIKFQQVVQELSPLGHVETTSLQGAIIHLDSALSLLDNYQEAEVQKPTVAQPTRVVQPQPQLQSTQPSTVSTTYQPLTSITTTSSPSTFNESYEDDDMSMFTPGDEYEDEDGYYDVGGTDDPWSTGTTYQLLDTNRQIIGQISDLSMLSSYTIQAIEGDQIVVAPPQPLKITTYSENPRLLLNTCQLYINRIITPYVPIKLQVLMNQGTNKLNQVVSTYLTRLLQDEINRFTLSLGGEYKPFVPLSPQVRQTLAKAHTLRVQHQTIEAREEFVKLSTFSILDVSGDNITVSTSSTVGQLVFRFIKTIFGSLEDHELLDFISPNYLTTYVVASCQVENDELIVSSSVYVLKKL